MNAKIFLTRFAAVAVTFACGVGFISFGQYLKSVFQVKKPESAVIQPAVKEETLFVPPRVETTPAPVIEFDQYTPPEFDAFGDYYLADEFPKGFQDFAGLSIVTRDFETDSEAYPNGIPIPPEGHVQAAAKHKFARISIGGRQIAFETEAKKGVSYKFVGKFHDEPKYDEATNSNIMIEGRLSKIRNGKKIAESDVRLAIDNSCSC